MGNKILSGLVVIFASLCFCACSSSDSSDSASDSTADRGIDCRTYTYYDSAGDDGVWMTDDDVVYSSGPRYFDSQLRRYASTNEYQIGSVTKYTRTFTNDGQMAESKTEYFDTSGDLSPYSDNLVYTFENGIPVSAIETDVSDDLIWDSADDTISYRNLYTSNEAGKVTRSSSYSAWYSSEFAAGPYALFYYNDSNRLTEVHSYGSSYRYSDGTTSDYLSGKYFYTYDDSGNIEMVTYEDISSKDTTWDGSNRTFYTYVENTKPNLNFRYWSLPIIDQLTYFVDTYVYKDGLEGDVITGWGKYVDGCTSDSTGDSKITHSKKTARFDRRVVTTKGGVKLLNQKMKNIEGTP